MDLTLINFPGGLSLDTLTSTMYDKVTANLHKDSTKKIVQNMPGSLVN